MAIICIIMIGYACLALGVPESQMKSTTLKNATDEHLCSIIEHNLNALETLIDYNILQDIKLFRISSDLIPFGSSRAMSLPWDDLYRTQLQRIGRKIREAGMRVSMHPGQYTVLNSPNPDVVTRAVHDLAYHARVLEALETNGEHKIILHLGGVYGDKEAAKDRFIVRFGDLPREIQKRIAIENDDRLFSIRDVLDVSDCTGIPVVFDNLHNAINPSDVSVADVEWINLASASWQKDDGRQKIHYSQQDSSKRPGAHSPTIAIKPFLAFYKDLPDVDIMLEVKDKNLSALKCINCVSNQGIASLEAEWARYKYSVLEHDLAAYQALRKLLKDKTAYPAVEMYQLIEAALAKEVSIGSTVNAAQHVWGYFKNEATPAEKRRWSVVLSNYSEGTGSLKSVKNTLQKLATTYDESYLTYSYYFSL